MLTAAPVPMKGGFPTFLRKVGSQAPDVDYHHPWYECTAAPEDSPKGRSFGTFSLSYADTLDRIPLYFRGRLAERGEERPPVEGQDNDGEARSAPRPGDDASYHDLDETGPKTPPSAGHEFEVVPVTPEAPPKKAGPTKTTKPRPPASKEGS